MQQTPAPTTGPTYLAIPVPDRRTAAIICAVVVLLLLIAIVPFLIFPIKVRLVGENAEAE